MLQGIKINYRGKNYRVQNANGWQHIIVTDKGKRSRIGISEINKPINKDSVYNYIFGGISTTHPFPAMDYWIYRHRLGRRISPKDYAIKFNIKQRK